MLGHRLKSRSQSGQTLIIAVLVLGVLLILGFTFASIVSRNITSAGRSGNRTVAGDVAESGIRYAHHQLQYSVQGADWRPVSTVVSGLSRDPDALYLRAGTNFPIRAAATLLDRGGPDGLGPYTRINYERGRALIRVRYAPADFTSFATGSGVLRQPGKAKNFIIIESVGRAGKFIQNDPSTLMPQAIDVTPANQNLLWDSLGKLKGIDVTVAQSRKLMAFAQIGLIDYARFITDKDNVSRPAEVGTLTRGSSGGVGLGAIYAESIALAQEVILENQYGGAVTDSNGLTLMIGTGSMRSNADIMLHGANRAFVNPQLGDGWLVAGEIQSANDASRLTLEVANGTGATSPVTIVAPDSRSASFSTNQGLLRDGTNDSDANGFPRSVGRLEAPSILTVDPNNNLNRYRVSSSESGALNNGRNIGRWGYGSGVYVDSNERGASQNESERETNAGNTALMQEWLNPGSPNTVGPGTRWAGPYYRPVAPNVQLLPDGFIITRSRASAQATWRLPNGNQSNLSSIRFRTREVASGDIYIINSVQHPALMSQAAPADADFINNGRQFNGILYFEGDVQVKGVIPTDVQISLVSMGTIYVNGSITKGFITENGTPLTRPSRSALMLMARDYVTLNTTMFFAPQMDQQVIALNADRQNNTPDLEAVKIDLDPNPTRYEAQFLLNSQTDAVLGINAGNPSTWRPYASTYQEFGTNAPISSSLLLRHSAETNNGTYIRMNVASETFLGAALNSTTSYGFFGGSDPILGGINSVARTYFTPNDNSLRNIPLYGLVSVGQFGGQFEILGTPIANSLFNYNSRQLQAPAGNATGAYRIATQDPTRFEFQVDPPAQSLVSGYLLARMAINPFNIKIEASMYAEEGSFFVIPGPWFNDESNDTRAVFEAEAASVSLNSAKVSRLTNFSHFPEAPFYAEPLNVKIDIIGSVSENMPPPIGIQAEWQRKWGWMPRKIGGTGQLVPRQHVPAGYDDISSNNPALRKYVPNLSISFDSALAIASADGFNPVRIKDGWVLPPMPRLPVSPTLAYFGETNP